MRGNLFSWLPPLTSSGSIPARAGEPTFSRVCREAKGVYPRACGGTPSGLLSRMVDQGLSPRVRGNRFQSFDSALQGGSIPARAGEPKGQCITGVLEGVYPRACGGTNQGDKDLEQCRGLSPRVRGNRLGLGVAPVPDGSIPARAGEPWHSMRHQDDQGVYPRACGGTQRPPAPVVVDEGLSPRVRGNRLGRIVPFDKLGSIPARAGEPRRDPALPN